MIKTNRLNTKNHCLIVYIDVQQIKITNLKINVTILKIKMTNLKTNLNFMSMLRKQINTMKIKFYRMRDLKNEYRKRSKIYQTQMINLNFDKNNMTKKIEIFFKKTFIQIRQIYLNDFDFNRFRQIQFNKYFVESK